jgi:hypothetical protein
MRTFLFTMIIILAADMEQTYQWKTEDLSSHWGLMVFLVLGIIFSIAQDIKELFK